MKEQHDMSRRSGTFRVAQDREVNGVLSLDSLNTSLYVWDTSRFDADQLSGTTIAGVLNDRTKVSLLKCWVTNEGYYELPGTTRTYTCQLLPQYVVFGDRHFSDECCEIQAVSCKLDNSRVLFHDTDAFGTVFNKRRVLEQILQSENPDREIVVEPGNWVLYYTGKSKIFSSDTVIGRVSAHHSSFPSFSFRSNPASRSDVFINIEFDDKLAITEALFRMKEVIQFLELVSGHAQRIPKINIHAETEDGQLPQDGEVYDSLGFLQKHSRKGQEEGEPNYWDILIHPVRDSKAFASVLKAWLDRDEEWHTARSLLLPDWSEQRRVWTRDRLTRAANVFDPLPEEEFGNSEPLSQEMQDAVRKTRKLFLGLDESDDRNMILSALGRVGSWTLKRKILHRVQSIIEVIGHMNPMITLIETPIDTAVRCRNLYVHGREKKVTPKLCDSCLPFLTDTLEFIFFASDLVDGGWDIMSWYQKQKFHDHPFSRYLTGYRSELPRLHAALENQS